ncbi:nuclear transport factor 2 family protein [Paractinoplanes atraurantiacus]|uniref:SnoaL-like domain-containing protein n=1 Tax=Paractinoplanes atraurantiacus TaxID=1036182 RepID=A0A285HRM3_9ACTN|nr:nuclear transport factor 2 family protein [Actinoplanes atraurantiacus]SNY38359.1 SnoaL-like domain-containing protein [Actinoplanes atraurantiacus]
MADLKIELARRNLLEVFGERDPEKRAKVIRETYAEDVTFADPDEVVVGWDSLDRKAQGLLDKAPGFVFAPVGEVRVVQDLTMLAWQFGPEDASPVVSGVDICIVADGRIKSLYTVLDA